MCYFGFCSRSVLAQQLRYKKGSNPLRSKKVNFTVISNRTRDEVMSLCKPTRSQTPRDRVVAKVCTRITKAKGNTATTKASKLIQSLNASILFSIDARAKLAMFKAQLQAKKVAVISGAGISVNAGSKSLFIVIDGIDAHHLQSLISGLYGKGIAVCSISQSTTMRGRQSVFIH